MQVGVFLGVDVLLRGYGTGRGNHIISQIPSVVGSIDGYSFSGRTAMGLAIS